METQKTSRHGRRRLRRCLHIRMSARFRAVNRIIGLFQFVSSLFSGVLELLGRRKGEHNKTGEASPEKQLESVLAPQQPPPPWFVYLGGVDDPPGSIPDGYDG